MESPISEMRRPSPLPPPPFWSKLALPIGILGSPLRMSSMIAVELRFICLASTRMMLVDASPRSFA